MLIFPQAHYFIHVALMKLTEALCFLKPVANSVYDMHFELYV